MGDIEKQHDSTDLVREATGFRPTPIGLGGLILRWSVNLQGTVMLPASSRRPDVSHRLSTFQFSDTKDESF